MSMSLTKSASSQEAPLSGLRTGAAYRESLRQLLSEKYRDKQRADV